MVRRNDTVYSGCIEEITNPWSSTNSEAASLFIPPSQFGHSSARSAISSSYLKLCVNRGGKTPVRLSAGFVGWQEKAGLRTETRRLKINLHTPEWFLWMKTPAGKNEFTSECRLQTRLTVYKWTNASIFFILLTTCFLSRQKPCKDNSSASFSEIFQRLRLVH